MSERPRGGWVEFTRAWNWSARKGRVTIAYRAGLKIRLTGPQLQSATAAGVVVSIPNPRHAPDGEPPWPPS